MARPNVLLYRLELAVMVRVRSSAHLLWTLRRFFDCIDCRLGRALMSIPFDDRSSDPPIHGFLHLPSSVAWSAMVLTHGAGSDCDAKLLVEMSSAFEASGIGVLRLNLPFREARPHGPPSPSGASRDRDGIRRAIAAMRERTKGQLFVGGHSYGGRQASMLVSEEPGLVEGLFLLSYPLHPPREPDQLRTSHFPKLTKPTFFVHGTRDPFASIEEMKSAVELISAPHFVCEVERAGHDLLSKKSSNELPARVVREFGKFMKGIVSGESSS